MSDLRKRTFLFQVNVTRDCNLRCTHCYISSDKKAASKFMNEAQFLSVFAKLSEFLQTNTAKRQYDLVEIHVIGGEPTMLGVDFYKNTLTQIKTYLERCDISFRLSIVTNLLTEQAVAIALLFDQVSTSYEVDTRFISTKGQPKPQLESLWVRNLQRLQQAGMDVAITMAVTRQSIAVGAPRVLDYLFSLGVFKIHLGFFIPSGDGRINSGSIAPTFESTSTFLCEAFEWYLKHRDIHSALYINPAESLIGSIYHNIPSDDIICPIIPGSLDIDWNGDTVTCIEAGGETFSRSLGNIFNSSIESILEGKEYRTERSKAVKPKLACITCDELPLCQSACGILHDSWSGKGECPGFKKFIKHVRHHVENGVKPKQYTEDSSGRLC